MFVNALYNVVDRIYIGNIKDIGHLGITGIGVVFPVVILIFAFSNSIIFYFSNPALIICPDCYSDT